MQRLAKPILWLLTTAIPVFIAACYGAPMEGEDSDKSVAGRVLSALTGSGISGIRVSCMVPGAEGPEVYDQAFSEGADGEFLLWTSAYSPCDTLLFEDVDGADNGAYQPLELQYADDGADVVAELEEQI